MKYFLDTEFLEGTQKVPSFFRKKETKPTIDLISIGIVAEDGREYYAISKDFNLKEAWNRYQIDTHLAIGGKVYVKVYWIREKVLFPIFKELFNKLSDESLKGYDNGSKVYLDGQFTYKNLKNLIKWYGKTNEQIAYESIRFIRNPKSVRPTGTGEPINFYAYYADYDWVAFCWLFGKMIDLPKGFPKYCRDLKQVMDDKAKEIFKTEPNLVYFDKELNIKNKTARTIEEVLNAIKNHSKYPKQDNEHNALDDAKWNKKLYEFLNTL